MTEMMAVRIMALPLLVLSVWISNQSYSWMVPRLKISHRLFAACCVAVIIDRGRLLPRGYRPKTTAAHQLPAGGA